MSKRTSTYESWVKMRARCNRKTHPKRHRYGGRGIKVCDRWNSYAAFLADMGERPEGTTIDRINNDGNYEPANCRWATQTEQQRNRSTTKLSLSKAAEIRERRKLGESREEIAAAFGVHSTTIQRIENHRTWLR
jgi:DNA-binding XRE family transcriptional regulator